MSSVTALQTGTALIADRDRAFYHVFIRDLMLSCMVGIHAHERGTPQRVRLNIDLGVGEPVGDFADRYETIIDYEKITNRVKALVDRGHVDLVETLAEMIAHACLEDRRIASARVRVEKIDVIPEAGSVGVEIVRHRTSETG